MRLAPCHGRTLIGQDVRIPRDFTGNRNAVLLAFEPDHLVFFHAWRAALREALAADPDLGFYAIALIGDVPQWHHRLTSWAMKFEIGEDFAREHIALVSLGPEYWADISGIPDIETPMLVIASREGEVFASADGPPRTLTSQAVARALLAT